MRQRSYKLFIVVNIMNYSEQAIGLLKKSLAQVAVAKYLGFRPVLMTFPIRTSAKRLPRLFRLIKKNNSETIIQIRYSVNYAPIIFMVLLYLRVRSAKILIVLDIPTPIKASLLISLKDKSSVTRNIVKTTNALTLLPFHLANHAIADRIIQYGTESSFLFNQFRQKIIVMGNISSDVFRPQKDNTGDTAVKDAKTLTIACVGSFNGTHNWQFLIRSMQSFASRSVKKIVIAFIGDGPDGETYKREAYETLQARDRSLLSLTTEMEIQFRGILDKRELDKTLRVADIGFGSLGWQYYGLTSAGPIKNKLYLSYGLPIFTTTPDPEIQNRPPYVYIIDKDDITGSILKNIELYLSDEKNSKARVKEYFSQNMSLSKTALMCYGRLYMHSSDTALRLR